MSIETLKQALIDNRKLENKNDKLTIDYHLASVYNNITEESLLEDLKNACYNNAQVKDIIIRHFGLLNNPVYSYKVIGETYNRSLERMRQICMKALRQLRRYYLRNAEFNLNANYQRAVTLSIIELLGDKKEINKENIIKRQKEEKIYIKYEYMEASLQEIIRSIADRKEKRRQEIIYQKLYVCEERTALLRMHISNMVNWLKQMYFKDKNEDILWDYLLNFYKIVVPDFYKECLDYTDIDKTTHIQLIINKGMQMHVPTVKYREDYLKEVENYIWLLPSL